MKPGARISELWTVARCLFVRDFDPQTTSNSERPYVLNTILSQKNAAIYEVRYTI